MSRLDDFKVRGYIRPAAAFYALGEWQRVIEELVDLQNQGMDTRGGEISCKHAQFCNPEDFEYFVGIVADHFWYQLSIEVDRYDLLTKKVVLDFVEDFVNHRFWSFEREYTAYFPDISRLRFAYFYSRGDLEPYVMLDDEYTLQIYGSLDNPAVVQHFTNDEGLARIEQAIASGEGFDISTFTQAERPFFRSESNLIVEMLGNIRAAFRSDIKSLALDNGRRACNMHRLEYPGRQANNICYDIPTCDDESVATGLWNEYIATPIEILGVTAVN
ncbi:MAG TPA: hypothetical protein EYG51_21215 [Pseudomonadales bacterium]|nr:hypothetical protein [Pseudomonadales bacterium]